MSVDTGVAPATPDIATRAELDLLEANRPAPAAAPHLVPDGPVVMDVHAQVCAVHEQRIADLHMRLERMRESAKTDYAFAQLDGRAKADFGQSR